MERFEQDGMDIAQTQLGTSLGYSQGTRCRRLRDLFHESLKRKKWVNLFTQLLFYTISMSPVTDCECSIAHVIAGGIARTGNPDAVIRSCGC